MSNLLEQLKCVDFIPTLGKNLSNLIEHMEFELKTVDISTVSPQGVILVCFHENAYLYYAIQL